MPIMTVVKLSAPSDRRKAGEPLRQGALDSTGLDNA
jgi:hypothetical protein